MNYYYEAHTTANLTVLNTNTKYMNKVKIKCTISTEKGSLLNSVYCLRSYNLPVQMFFFLPQATVYTPYREDATQHTALYQFVGLKIKTAQSSHPSIILFSLFPSGTIIQIDKTFHSFFFSFLLRQIFIFNLYVLLLVCECVSGCLRSQRKKDHCIPYNQTYRQL